MHPQVSAEFVAHMEDVLDPVSSTGQALDDEPYDPRRPVVCFDETSTQLLAAVRPPLPAQQGDQRGRTTSTAGGHPQPVSGHVSRWPAGGTWRSPSGVPCRTSPSRCAGGGRGLPGGPGGGLVLDNLNTHRDSVPVRDLLGDRGPPDRQTAGVPLHPQARELVEIWRKSSSACCPAPASSSASPTNRPSGGRSKPWSRSEMPPRGHHQLAVQHPGPQGQTSPPHIPLIPNMTTK